MIESKTITLKNYDSFACTLQIPEFFQNQTLLKKQYVDLFALIWLFDDLNKDAGIVCWDVIQNWKAAPLNSADRKKAVKVEKYLVEAKDPKKWKLWIDTRWAF